MVTEWLRIAEREGDEHEALRAQNAAALHACDQGNFDQARRLFDAVGTRAAEAGDRMIVAFVTVNLSVLFARAGDYEAGIEYAARAVELFREFGDENGQAVAIATSGWCSLGLSDPAQAARDFHVALTKDARQGAFRTGAGLSNLLGLAASLVALDVLEPGVRILGGREALREETGRGEGERTRSRYERAPSRLREPALASRRLRGPGSEEKR